MSSRNIVLMSVAVVGSVIVAFLPSVAAADGAAATFSCAAAALPNPSGESSSSGIAVNDSGTVIGSTIGAEFLSHGAIWQNGVATDLGHFRPAAINQRGLVVGVEQGPDSFDHAMILRNGVLTPLPENGGQGSSAFAVNNRGDVVGTLLIDGAEHAVLWPAGRFDAMVVLDTSTARTFATGVDDDGFIIGADSGAIPTSFVWRTDGSLVRTYDPDSGLELLAVSAGLVAAEQTVGAEWQVVAIDAQSGAVEPVPGSTGGEPSAVNVHGTIVGDVLSDAVGFTAMLWRHGNGLALPALPTAVPLHAFGISRDGRYVVGESGDGGNGVATVWTCG